jgi:hypothetical protein
MYDELSNVVSETPIDIIFGTNTIKINRYFDGFFCW